jgi:hypothetical protein
MLIGRFVIACHLLMLAFKSYPPPRSRPGATKAQQNTVLQHTALGEAGASTPKCTCGLPALGRPWDLLSMMVNINLEA